MTLPIMPGKDNGSHDGAYDDGLSPFRLFCAYHLGLDARGRKRFNNIHDVARGAAVDRDTVDTALARHGLDAESMMKRDFDLVGAQLDIQVSPPGVDLLSLAEMHWELFVASPVVERDWAQEARDAAVDNEKIFGKR